jgi:hypothetical protein
MMRTKYRRLSGVFSVCYASRFGRTIRIAICEMLIHILESHSIHPTLKSALVSMANLAQFLDAKYVLWLMS